MTACSTLAKQEETNAACILKHTLTGALCLLEEMPLCLAGRASFLGATVLARLGNCSAAMRALLRAMCSARSRSYADISSTFCTMRTYQVDVRFSVVLYV